MVRGIVTPLVYSPRYDIDIGPHVFQTEKYGLVHDQLVERQLIAAHTSVEPDIASWDDLALVHTREYLRKLQYGQLALSEVVKLEMPWSDANTEGFRLMAGGTVTAARQALSQGGAVHVGGGFHHAFADHGEGFCMFNDVALAIRVLQRGGAIARAAVVDCDVHHGNGTASIFSADPTVFTLSMHQKNNYPMHKPASTLDIALADLAGDDEYLRRLAEALPAVMAHQPDVIFYLAGADPYERDQLGGLGLTQAGLAARDRLVFERAREVAFVVTLAGGYAHDVSETVAIHVATIEEAVRVGAVGARS